MQLHTILDMYYILNYINITSILHACNASVITCNYMQLHAITCNITCKLHAFKTFNSKRFNFQRNYMIFRHLHVITCLVQIT